MKIVVVGANGQLGRSIEQVVSLEAGGMSNLFSFLSREDLQVTDRTAVDEYFDAHEIDVLINCTAFTAVDMAEDEPDLAFDVNVNAVSFLAEACEKKGTEFFHVSTDFVFDGLSDLPYKELDETNPLSVYGRTKLEGELIALKLCSKTQVIRTSWLYSAFGNNFVKTIIRLASDRERLTIVDDQVGTPTNAFNLARAILKMVFAKKKHFGETYHFSDQGQCSWCEFASEIVRLKDIDCVVSPITSEEYPQKACRPKFSVMDKSKIIADYGLVLMDWRMSLESLVCLF